MCLIFRSSIVFNVICCVVANVHKAVKYAHIAKPKTIDNVRTVANAFGVANEQVSEHNTQTWTHTDTHTRIRTRETNSNMKPITNLSQTVCKSFIVHREPLFHRRTHTIAIDDFGRRSTLHRHVRYNERRQRHRYRSRQRLIKISAKRSLLIFIFVSLCLQMVSS